MSQRLKRKTQLPMIHKTELNRARFFLIVKETLPEVFTSLRDRVRPILGGLLSHGLVSPKMIHPFDTEGSIPRINLRKLKSLVKIIMGDSDALADWPDESHSTIEQLKLAVSSWANQYQINRMWVVERALETLLLGSDPKGGMVERLASPNFVFEGWKREIESKSRYERRVWREFKTYLTGYTKIMQRAVPDGHLAQLALYLCRGMKPEEIAKMGGPTARMDLTTAFRHIRRAATELDVPLRKPGKIARV